MWVTSRVLCNILWELLYSQHNASQSMTETTAPARFAADFQILAKHPPGHCHVPAYFQNRLFNLEVFFCKLAIQKEHYVSTSPSRHRWCRCEPRTCDQHASGFSSLFLVFWHLHLVKPASLYYHACDWRRVSENNIHLSWNLFTHCPNPHPIIRHVRKRTYSNVASSTCASAREGIIA